LAPLAPLGTTDPIYDGSLDGVTVATGDGGRDFFILSSSNTRLGAVGPSDGGGRNLLDPLARSGDHAACHGSGVIGNRG
jgi:hypothetical protein